MSDFGQPPTGPVQQPDFAQPQNPDVPDYLVWSILETLFCCLPFGIIGIVFSAQANSKKGNGDFQGAHNDAQQAKKFLKWGLIIGIVANVLIIAFYVALVVIGFSADTSSSNF